MGRTLRRMSWRGIRGVVVGACAVAWMATTPTSAWGRKAKAPPQQERLQEPEAPPPSFIAPPPGYEPPPQFQPGDATAPPPPVYEEPLPGFMTLDRMDANSRVGAQLGWDKIDDVRVADAFAMRLEPFGQYLLPNRAIGLFGHVPLSHLFDLDAADGTGIGNLELGGFYLPNRRSDLIVRVGLALPTASDSVSGALANLDTRFERLTDFVLIGPSYTSLRLSGSTVQQWNSMFFLRADAGLDAVLSKPSTASGATSVFGRANVAGAVRASGVDFTLELVNLIAFNGTSVPSGFTNHLTHTAALSVRSPGADQFHFGLVFPLDNEFRGDAWVIALGYQRTGF